ncbi:retrovirus-related pol polyprotein from transposon TNT 1-94, partial [Tanacetum coccineum]
MAASSNSLNVSQPQIPIFKGDSYEFWSIKMKTLFISQELWEYVESGYAETSDDNTRHKENQKRDAKALFFIQQVWFDRWFVILDWDSGLSFSTSGLLTAVYRFRRLFISHGDLGNKPL